VSATLDKGLREHQQVKHRNSYEGSKAAVADSRMALVALGGGAGAGAVRYGQRTVREGEAGGSGDGGGGRGGGGGGGRDDDGRTPSEKEGSADGAAAITAARDSLDPGLAAARDGDLASLRALVAADGGGGWDPRRATDRHGSTALHWAAGSGRLDTCRFLVEECGMDPKGEQPRDGRTAMHWAARNGQTEVCEWLWASHGVDVNRPTKDGTTPFHWSTWQGHLDTCRWLVDVAGADWATLNKFGCNAVQWAAQTGDLDTCEYLRELGLDLALKNNNGHSALHKAAVKGRRGACEWLVRVAGLSLPHMGPDGDGNTPAEMARLEGHVELSEWLAKRCAEAAAAATTAATGTGTAVAEVA
jgi:hypothetical protein